MLGDDDKGRPERARQCFESCKALHEQVLGEVDSDAARAVVAFFRKWKPEDIRKNPALAESLEEILSGSNLVFRTEAGYTECHIRLRE